MSDKKHTPQVQWDVLNDDPLDPRHGEVIDSVWFTADCDEDYVFTSISNQCVAAHIPFRVVRADCPFQVGAVVAFKGSEDRTDLRRPITARLNHSMVELNGVPVPMAALVVVEPAPAAGPAFVRHPDTIEVRDASGVEQVFDAVPDVIGVAFKHEVLATLYNTTLRVFVNPDCLPLSVRDKVARFIAAGVLAEHGEPTKTDFPDRLGGPETGVVAIWNERVSQRKKWAADHDDNHCNGDLAYAAGALALWNLGGLGKLQALPEWAFDLGNKHKGDQRRRLVIAGALLAAEIDRLDRETAGMTVPSVSGNVAESVVLSECGDTDGDGDCHKCVGEQFKCPNLPEVELNVTSPGASDAPNLTEVQGTFRNGAHGPPSAEVRDDEPVKLVGLIRVDEAAALLIRAALRGAPVEAVHATTLRQMWELLKPPPVHTFPEAPPLNLEPTSSLLVEFGRGIPGGVRFENGNSVIAAAVKRAVKRANVARDVAQADKDKHAAACRGVEETIIHAAKCAAEERLTSGVIDDGDDLAVCRATETMVDHRSDAMRRVASLKHAILTTIAATGPDRADLTVMLSKLMDLASARACSACGDIESQTPEGGFFIGTVGGLQMCQPCAEDANRCEQCSIRESELFDPFTLCEESDTGDRYHFCPDCSPKRRVLLLDAGQRLKHRETADFDYVSIGDVVVKDRFGDGDAYKPLHGDQLTDRRSPRVPF